MNDIERDGANAVNTLDSQAAITGGSFSVKIGKTRFIGKRLTKRRTCQTQSPSEKIVPWSGCVFLRAVLKIHALAEKIH